MMSPSLSIALAVGANNSWRVTIDCVIALIAVAVIIQDGVGKDLCMQISLVLRVVFGVVAPIEVLLDGITRRYV